MTEIKANEDAALVAEVARHHAHGHEAGGHGHGAAHGEPHEYPYVAHHFDSPQQQFDSGKLGIWLFLVTEILFFAGLFCAYTIYRAQHPEVFYWAHFFLDTNLGALNTIVLILSSLTAAWAVRNAQLGQTKLLKINILVTIACALTFMGVKYVEYSHKIHDGLLPARHFDPKHEVWEVDSFKSKHPEAAAAMTRIMASLEARKTARLDTALPEQRPLALIPVKDEAPSQDAPAAAPAGDEAKAPPANPPAPTVAQGATATPGSTPGAEAQVGVPAQDPAAEPAEEGGTDQPAAPPSGEGAAPVPSPVAPPAQAAEEPPLQDDVFLANELRKLTPAEAVPLLRAGVIQRRSDGPFQLVRPEKAGVFFSIYFFMTGLHGIHVLVGIGIWVWMLVRAGRRRFGPHYFGPIDFSALYWHLVDLIWIYLFPLLYLIH